MRHVMTTIVLTIAMLGSEANALVVYVDDDALIGGGGTSWGGAFSDLAEALASAESGDEIWVAAGTYVPGPTDGFALREGVSLYGGFGGWESEREQRDWEANDTILSGPGRVARADDAEAVVLDGLTIVNGVAPAGAGPQTWGGGVRIGGGGPITISHCTFTDNSAFLGGALMLDRPSAATISDCSFVSNGAQGGSALYCIRVPDLSIERCTFRANVAVVDAAMVLLGCDTTITSTQFLANVAGEIVGALGATFWEGGWGSTTMINCVFSRNSADLFAGAVLLENQAEIINCTFSQNSPGALHVNSLGSSSAEVVNSVIWGSDGSDVELGNGLSISSSCVEGDWPGSGNIDADPLFVQAGTDDVRLSFDSPCLNAGDNSALPPGITTDLAGAPRIFGGTVDMGAYEGAFEPLPQAVQTDDLDEGEAEILIPSGGSLLDSAWVLVQNVSGDDNAVFSVAEPEDAHGGAGGYAEASSVLAISTTLDDGRHLTRVTIPFDETDLGGADPLEMNATYFAQSTSTWGLAVSRNTANSPGHTRPIGDRYVTQGDGLPQPTDDLGDYGVHWNSPSGTGVVWANVDHASEFGAGAASCIEDCFQPPDERIGFIDLTAVLGAWGVGNGPFDVDGDGTVGANDLTAVVVAWGLCPP